MQPRPHNNTSITRVHNMQPRPHNISIIVIVGLLACLALGYLLGEVIYHLVRCYVLCRPANRGNGNTDPEAAWETERERERAREARKERLREGKRKLSLMPLVNYKRDHDMTLSRECAICLEDFEDDDVCRVVTGCNHAFHALCVDDWLKKHHRCPVCRGSI